MNCRWVTKKANAEVTGALVRELGVSRVAAECLFHRGIFTPADGQRWLNPRLRDLADPFAIPNLGEAVDCILRARTPEKRVTIFGDYDVDGVTASTLLSEVLEALGWRVNVFLPDRMAEGYGLSSGAVKHCLDAYPTDLLLAVDCGSTSGAVIAEIMAQGIEVVVLDHHQISSPAPVPTALVNPRLYPAGDGTDYCSVGLAFKLAHALVKRGRVNQWTAALEFDLRRLLDLVAVGTIADVVPLLRENRILVAAGLERLKERPAWRALREVASISGKAGVQEVAFQIAPRLNAAGRLETARSALDLLTTRDPEKALGLARQLDGINRERQRVERSISESILESLQSRFNPADDFVIVEGDSGWHIGVVGIVAARVVQQFYRPAIIVGGDGDDWRGSGRSVEGFDLSSALNRCAGSLTRFGGHAMAAGLSLQPSRLEEFRKQINAYAREVMRPEHLQRVLRLDGEAALSELSLEMVRDLGRLEPHGMGNPPVHFLVRGLAHQRAPARLGKENQHAKFWVTDGVRTLEAVWWNCGPEAPLPKVLFDLACTPEINSFRDRCSVQLKVLDWGNVGAGEDGR